MIFIIKWEKYPEELSKFDILINATSLGLVPGEEPKIKLNNLKKSMIFIDTIYNPKQTNFLKKAKNLGNILVG